MYGLLRIFDGIQPYRLEMGTSGLAKHRVCPDGSDNLCVPCSTFFIWLSPTVLQLQVLGPPHR